MTQTETNTQTKNALANTILLCEPLIATLLQQEPESRLAKVLLDYQRKTMTSLPQQTQLWVTKQLQQPKVLDILPKMMKNYLKSETLVGEVIQNHFLKIIELLSLNYPAASKLSINKYIAVMKFFEQELIADMTGGESSFMVEHGTNNLIFKLETQHEGTMPIRMPK